MQALVISFYIPQVPFLNRDVEIAELEVALDSISSDPFSNDLVASPTQCSEYVLHVFVDMFRDVLFARYSADKLTAITPGCSPADFVGFDDMYVITSLDQVQCRRYPREACADNANVRSLIAE